MLYKPLDLPYKHNVYDGVPVPPFITEQRMEEIKKTHQSRSDDIYIATYQKSGTTWLQFVVYEIIGKPQGDYEQISAAAPWLQAVSHDLVENLVSPRLLKTHDKWKWVPKGDGIKYIYCYRNPKDVAVSYYNHKQRLDKFDGSFNDFMSDVFLKYNCSAYGYYFEHVAEWLEQKENPNILILTFEDMVEDLRREIKRIGTFLSVNLDNNKLEEIVTSGMFSAMQKNPKVNYSWFEGNIIEGKSTFMRKGKVGDCFLTEE